MNFNDLLRAEGIDPAMVVVFRHRPREPELRKVLPWLAAERPDVFNAYQQGQSSLRVENALKRLVTTGYVAAFFGHEPARAVFVGLYSIAASSALTPREFWKNPALEELVGYGLERWFTDDMADDGRPTAEWFDLVITDFCQSWKGKLTVDWPPPERSWWRRAQNNQFTIFSIREECYFDVAMPDWQEIDLSWEELKILPTRWKQKISQWRGVYYIYDRESGKGYVGSAYGETNLLGRWENYAATGHGGNTLLRTCNPRSLRFSILQRVSPDMEASDVVKLESTWKRRLHTLAPEGLNDN